MLNKIFFKKLSKHIFNLFPLVFFHCNNNPISQQGSQDQKINPKYDKTVIQFENINSIKDSTALNLENVKTLDKDDAIKIFDIYRKHSNNECFKDKKLVRILTNKCIDRPNFTPVNNIQPFSGNIPSDPLKELNNIKSKKNFKDAIDNVIDLVDSNSSVKNSNVNMDQYPDKKYLQDLSAKLNDSNVLNNFFTKSKINVRENENAVNFYSAIADSAAQSFENFSIELYKKGLKQNFYSINDKITIEKIENNQSTTQEKYFFESLVDSYLQYPSRDIPPLFPTLKKYENNLKMKKQNLLSLQNKINKRLEVETKHYNYLLNIYDILEKKIIAPFYSLNKLKINKLKFNELSVDDKKLLDVKANVSLNDFIELKDSIDKNNVGTLLKNMYESLFPEIEMKTSNWFKYPTSFQTNSLIFKKIFKNVLSKDLLISKFDNYWYIDNKWFKDSVLNYLFYIPYKKMKEINLKPEYYTFNKEIINLISIHSSENFRKDFVNTVYNLKDYINIKTKVISNWKAILDLTNKVQIEN